MTRKQAVPALTSLAIAVLALLEERPMHPYEMYQLLSSRHEDEIIKIRPGSLYHTVTRLAEQELVVAEGTDRAGNRPERTTYRIETAGSQALRSRVAEILREPVNEYPIFPVALAEAHNLPRDEVIALLTERITWLEGRLTELTALHEWAANRQVPRRYWTNLDFIRHITDAEVAWLRGFIAELGSGELEWEDIDPHTGDRIRCPEEGMGHDWGAALTDEDLARVRTDHPR
ncbi:PadR family transcriptional regulator [Nocardia sp. NPDC088792]|uniref:PadR family transcriptional regulator n=1 Tax=Nocardia sp. NPDC088792 TaxID=3364332 RepID=UPI0037FBE3CA